jgi:hypothetical protein
MATWCTARQAYVRPSWPFARGGRVTARATRSARVHAMRPRRRAAVAPGRSRSDLKILPLPSTDMMVKMRPKERAALKSGPSLIGACTRPLGRAAWEALAVLKPLLLFGAVRVYGKGEIHVMVFA